VKERHKHCQTSGSSLVSNGVHVLLAKGELRDCPTDSCMQPFGRVVYCSAAAVGHYNGHTLAVTDVPLLVHAVVLACMLGRHCS
jgi:hypothetical protein